MKSYEQTVASIDRYYRANLPKLAMTDDAVAAKVADHIAGEMTTGVCVQVFRAIRLGDRERLYALMAPLADNAVAIESEYRALDEADEVTAKDALPA
jgi:hypothetical protein